MVMIWRHKKKGNEEEDDKEEKEEKEERGKGSGGDGRDHCSLQSARTHPHALAHPVVVLIARDVVQPEGDATPELHIARLAQREHGVQGTLHT
jgi:hypothetical protein